MKQYYKDFYGCTASITQHSTGESTLVIRSSAGKTIKKSKHKTLNAARSAMYRTSDGWHKTN